VNYAKASTDQSAWAVLLQRAAPIHNHMEPGLSTCSLSSRAARPFPVSRARWRAGCACRGWFNSLRRGTRELQSWCQGGGERIHLKIKNAGRGKGRYWVRYITRAF